MRHLPHWQQAAKGLRIGLAKQAIFDYLAVMDMDEAALERMRRSTARLMIGLTILEDFSTRDYAYDRGGYEVGERERAAYRFAVWSREDGG